MIKKILKAALAICVAIVLVIVAYMAYVLIAYHRIEDMTRLEVIEGGSFEQIETGKEYTISSSNMGFGAYSDDYSFFMDGGTESWAYSKESAQNNITGQTQSVMDISPDIMLFQEVDIDSTRSYHLDEYELIRDLLFDRGFEYAYTFAQNYDSPFLMYPLNQPHGASKAGLVTASDFSISSAIRRSLPIEEGFTKLIDLDRCYSKNYIQVANGSQLVLYNVHLSAYTTNPSTAENQVKMLNEDMTSELEKGNYIIAGGDMNKDMLGDSSKYFGIESDALWAQPFPEDLVERFTVVGPLDEAKPVASCRNADKPYDETSFVLTIDGFIVSDNVKVTGDGVIDNGFKYSDHNPVYMKFELK
ncbi:MAG: endonuclease/exonuclease/phosphatase family protein [Pseudobutyrivibrio sp.]|nr:endonuclease/exonuclease/phosphatase family protein [Pseudobutyrivibrio sp.]